jgi:glycosyltransferase involved in cell wall biosynthesis
LRLDSLASARQIHAALAEAAADADLLHLHSNGLIVEVASAWARRRKKPTVLTLYGTEIWHYEPRSPIDPFRRAYDHAAEVTFYSQGLLDHARSLGLTRAGLSVVYPAVRPVFRHPDTAERERWRAELGIREPRVILNVKRLHELAGQDVLVDAFAALTAHRRDVRLVICGTGPKREALARQAAALGLSDRVTFTGLGSNDLVARFAGVAAEFAQPSRLEALPTVAVEALAAGTPVVSADHPGGVELHGLFGDDVRIVAREDVGGLAGALAAALEAPRRATTNTRDLVRQQFGADAVRSAYEQVYARVLAGVPSRRV